MSWNKPSTEETVKRIEGKSTGRFLAYAMIAAIAVIGGIVLCLFVFRNNEKPQSIAEKSSARRVINTIAPTNHIHAQPSKAEIKQDPNARPTKIGEKLNGYIMLSDGTLHRIAGEITNNVSRIKSPCAIFHNPSENIIASILTIKPGQNLVGRPMYNGKFTEAFLKSLTTPIVVKEDDTPENAQLKRAVIEAKIELKAAYDRGEDIEAILAREREECQMLAKYKKELSATVHQYISKNAVSQEDVETFVAAANKMLEAKGIAPIKPGVLGKIKIKMEK